MEISITLNNELVFDREFTKADLIKGVAIGSSILLISLTLVLASTSIPIAATTKPVGNLIIEELFRVLAPCKDLSDIESALRRYFPIDLETAEYIAKLYWQCFRDGIARDITNDSIPFIKAVNDILNGKINGKIFDDFIKLSHW